MCQAVERLYPQPALQAVWPPVCPAWPALCAPVSQASPDWEWGECRTSEFLGHVGVRLRGARGQECDLWMLWTLSLVPTPGHTGWHVASHSHTGAISISRLHKLYKYQLEINKKDITFNLLMVNQVKIPQQIPYITWVYIYKLGSKVQVPNPLIPNKSYWKLERQNSDWGLSAWG